MLFYYIVEGQQIMVAANYIMDEHYIMVSLVLYLVWPLYTGLLRDQYSLVCYSYNVRPLNSGKLPLYTGSPLHEHFSTVRH